MANEDRTKIEPRPVQKHSRRARPGNINAQTHGLTVLKRAVNGLGNRLIDKRTATGRALAEWRKELVDDLGGPDAISAQQSAVIELAVKSKLLIDSIDVWLLTQESLVNKRKRSLIPAVIQRQALADGLVRYMTALGLERRAAKTKTLSEWLAEAQSDATGKDNVAVEPDACVYPEAAGTTEAVEINGDSKEEIL